jgi:hypothetical protein
LDARSFAFTANGTCDRVLVYDPAAGEQALHWLAFSPPSACTPLGWNKGLLVPTTQAEIDWRDPRSGAPLARPFLPTVRIGSLPAWATPAVVSGEPARFAVSDGRGSLYLVGLRSEPEPHLAAFAETSAVSEPPIGPPVALGDTVYLPQANGLAAFRLPDLEPAARIDLTARPLWGPYVVADRLLIATDRNELICVAGDGSIRWRRGLPESLPVGTPTADAAQVWLSVAAGSIWQLRLDSGDILREVATTRRLASGPVLIEHSLVVATHDGSLLVLPGAAPP